MLSPNFISVLSSFIDTENHVVEFGDSKRAGKKSRLFDNIKRRRKLRSEIGAITRGSEKEQTVECPSSNKSDVSTRVLSYSRPR